VRPLVKINPLAIISGRAGLVTLGLGVVAGTALILGAAVGFMLAPSAPESGLTAATGAAEAALPDPMPGLNQATVAATETPDRPIQTPDQRGGASATASATVPATASIVDPEPVMRAPAAVTPQPQLAHLPLDLGPRVAHALAALEPTGFLVQAGSFANERDATVLAETIAGVATPVRVTPFVDAQGRGSWQVAAGPFPDAPTATAMAADIRRVVGLSPLIRSVEFGE
jgi:cell division septation protein DedD